MKSQVSRKQKRNSPVLSATSAILLEWMDMGEKEKKEGE